VGTFTSSRTVDGEPRELLGIPTDGAHWSPIPFELEGETDPRLRTGQPQSVTANARCTASRYGGLSDEWLLLLAARRDERALGELYDRYGPTAYTLACRTLCDRALAEDAVQEAFLTVWRCAERFSPARGSARAWILTLVHRRAVDLIRGSKGRQHDPLEVLPEVADEHAVAAISAVHERERVRAALGQLSVEFRQPLELAYYGGLTQREVAARLGEPIGTIKSRMHRGLARMRQLLATTEATQAVASPAR
jgi:RNA polymerase sigma-70 factor, ECF subfamily